MKVIWKRYLALVLAITLVISCGVFSSDRFLRATDGKEAEVDVAEKETEGLIIEDEDDDQQVVVVEEGTFAEEEEHDTQNEEAHEDTQIEDTQIEDTQIEDTQAEDVTEEATQEADTEAEDIFADAPAAVCSVKTADGALITVEAPEGTLPEGFYVTAYYKTTDQKIIEAALDKDTEIVSYAVYNVSIYDSKNQLVQPSDKVKVIIKAPGIEEADGAAAFHITDNKIDKIVDVEDPEEAEIIADHFSEYGVVTYESNKKVYVAVYATSGTMDGINSDMEDILGLHYKQPDGYYPVGVIQLPEALFTGKSPYIRDEADYEIVMNAFKDISQDELINGGAKNKGNKVAGHLDTVREDYKQSAGSQHTALFDWNTSEAQNAIALKDGNNYAYHLDLRFSTLNLKFTSVYEQSKDSFTVGQAGDLGNRIYLSGTKTIKPGTTSAEWYIGSIKAGYSIDGYYTDSACKTEYEFGKRLTADTVIYVKLIKKKIEIKYDLNGGVSTSEKFTFTDLTVGSEMPKVNEPTRAGYRFVGWNDGNIDYSSNDKLPNFASESANYTAQWNAVKITYTSSDGGSVYITEETIGDDGKYKGSTATPNDGYHFVGWVDEDGTVVSTDPTFKPTPSADGKDKEYKAVFEKNIEIKIKGEKTEATYDGNEHASEGFVITDTKGNPLKDIKVDGVVGSITGTDAGEYEYTPGGDTIKITDKDGKDITDWYDITYEPGKLTIKKRKVVLTSGSATKEYDGSPLTNSKVEVSGDGFADGQGATYKVTGQATAPETTVDNDFTYTLNKGTDAKNYNIEQKKGKLTITNRKTPIAINIVGKSDTVKYNGKTQEISGVSVAGKTDGTFEIGEAVFTIEGASAKASGKDSGEYEVSVDISKVVIKDAAGNDVTSQFAITPVAGKLTIDKRSVTLTSATDSKEYDGKPLTNNEIEVGGDKFIKGEGAHYEVTGSQLEVGTSANNFSYKLNEGTNKDNYAITLVKGLLTVKNRDAKYAITVTANSNNGEVKYNGTEQVVTGFVDEDPNKGIPVVAENGETYYVVGLTAEGKGTDAGEYPVNVTGTAKVYDKTGNDVTSEFAITPVAGTLTINKRNVTLTSATDSKAYDGKPLTNETITVSNDGFVKGEGVGFKVIGSQINVGSSNNEFSYSYNDNTNPKNYVITKVLGTLTVTNRPDNAKFEITVTAKSNTDDYKYDGKEHKSEGFVNQEGDRIHVVIDGVDYYVTGLVAEGKGTDAGTYPVNVTGIPVVTDADGNVVTDQFVVNTENGILSIAPRSIVMTSATAQKEYDGAPLTRNDPQKDITVTGDGFVDGEGVEYSITGSQTLKGSSSNDFSYKLKPNTKAKNYSISVKIGTLTVLDRSARYDIVVRARSGKFVYTGATQVFTGILRTEFTVDGRRYTVEGISAETKGKTVGEYPMVIAGDAIVKDDADNDVTDQFNVIKENGVFEITKLMLTATSESATKKYDGTPLTNDKVTLSGTIPNADRITFDVTGSQTLVGESANTFTYSFDDPEKALNYEITKEEGTLKVTDRDESELYEITVEANSSNDNRYDGQKKNVSGFKTLDFVVNGQSYKVSGLTAEAAETDAGSYPVKVEGSAVVTDAAGNDVTAQFAVKTVDGILEIAKRTVTLTSATETKQYDGTPLTNTTITVTGDGFVDGEGAIYKVTGIVREPNTTVENAFTYTLKDGTKAGNYDITTKFGTLSITNRAEDAKYEITVKAIGGSYIYDGMTKIADRIETTSFMEGDVEFTVSGLNAYGTGIDAGSYTVNITGTAKVTDPEGIDVTDQFIVNTQSATLEIRKRNVVITSASAEKTYDGNVLTAPSVIESGDGFVAGEGACYSFSGQQTLPGISSNYFAYELVNANPANYNIERVYGTLNVLSRGTEDAPLYEITMIPNSATVAYNGKEQSVTGFESTSFIVEDNTYRVSGLEAIAKGTAAGVYNSEVTGEAVVVDEAGNDVTDQFMVHVGEGYLTIKGVHTLTINYVDINGKQLAPSFVNKYVVGEQYGPIMSPEIGGYTPSYASISSDENGMPDQDVTVDVVYTKNASDDENNGPDDENNPDDDDAIITPTPVVPDDGNDPEDAVPDEGTDADRADESDVRAPDGQVTMDDDGNADIKAIVDDEVPLAGNEQGAWALINFILMLLTLILCLLLFITYFMGRRDKDDEEIRRGRENEPISNMKNEEHEDESEIKRHGIIRILSLIPAVVSVIAFVLTEDMTQPMILRDQWTILMFIILIVELILAVLSIKTKDDDDEKEKA